MTRATIIAVIITIGIAAAFAVRMASRLSTAAAHANEMDASFVANPANDTVLSVRGWSKDELDRIIADFSNMYRDRAMPPLVVTQQPGSICAITFPQDISPSLLFYLVNYIQYPNGFDLKQRNIGAVAHTSLTSAFGIPNASLIGKRAAIYVPTNDKSYDLVYAKVQSSEATYEISFTDFVWQPVPDARMPGTIKGL